MFQVQLAQNKLIIAHTLISISISCNLNQFKKMVLLIQFTWVLWQTSPESIKILEKFLFSIII